MRNVDAQGWELHLRDPYSSGNKAEYLSHDSEFLQGYQVEELDSAKAMVKRTQVDLRARGEYDRTPLH